MTRWLWCFFSLSDRGFVFLTSKSRTRKSEANEYFHFHQTHGPPGLEDLSVEFVFFFLWHGVLCLDLSPDVAEDRAAVRAMLTAVYCGINPLVPSARAPGIIRARSGPRENAPFFIYQLYLFKTK